MITKQNNKQMKKLISHKIYNNKMKFKHKIQNNNYK